jgi:beta-glucosidase
MQISREYNHPIIEITESGCGYLDTPYEKAGGHVPDTRRIDFFRAELAELARAISDGAKVAPFTRGRCWTISNGQTGTANATGSPTSISVTRNAP